MLKKYIVITLMVGVSWISTQVIAESCSNKCADAGYNDSKSDGTAPFCSGNCIDVWNGAVDYGDSVAKDVGKSTDGSSCISGEKRCCCRAIHDCKSACKNSGKSIFFRCVPYSEHGYKSPIVGWCDANLMCLCGYD